MADPYWKDKLHERYAEEAAEAVREGWNKLSELQLQNPMITHIAHELDHRASVKEWERQKPFSNMEHRDRFEGWILRKKIKFEYVAFEHQAKVTIFGTDITFKEAYEVFPSEWMVAQIALALECAK